jgi:putative membrane protein
MIIESFISVLRGFAMGAADIVPGVSGGTIALVLGFYERLVASVRSGSSALGAMVRGDFSGFKSWLGKVEWALIIPLLVGILVAIVSLAHIIEELLHEEPVAMASLFVGLVAGSMVIAWMMLKRPVLNHVWIALAVGVAVFLILGLRSGTSEESVNQLADPALWAFFASGAVAICAGAIVGLGLFSQFLHRALTNHHDAMLAGLIGLMGGSLRVLWPWPLGVDSTDLGAPDSDVGLAIGMAVVGFVVVIAIARVALRYERRQETISDPI